LNSAFASGAHGVRRQESDSERDDAFGLWRVPQEVGWDNRAFPEPILSGKDEHGSRESLVISHPQNRPKAVSRSLSLSCHTHSMGARKLHDCTGYFPLAQRTDSQTIES